MWVPDVIKNYHPDSIRYFLTINAPEKRDTDFSWREFIYSHNSELLGAYGNFVNRTLKFIEKSFNGEIPTERIDQTILGVIPTLYKKVGYSIENTHFKEALEDIFAFIRNANKYFDAKQPWKQWRENIEECSSTLATCVYIIANLTQLLSPFLPFSSNEVKNILNINELCWKPIHVQEKKIKPVKPLFERIDITKINIEIDRLINQSK